MSEIRIEKIDIEGVLQMMARLDVYAGELEAGVANKDKALADLCRAVSFLIGRSLI